ncbi:hypothetical protein [Noviherbaspirillum aerium]|uniref:hypothetical protein n=1 Tax=Noviherbaspirillum aerium TaxID=2588497 RepID=UPI00124CEDE4|nr:hypothetical protein [Noviherbaspirillum aerium]
MPIWGVVTDRLFQPTRVGLLRGQERIKIGAVLQIYANAVFAGTDNGGVIRWGGTWPSVMRLMPSSASAMTTIFAMGFRFSWT